MIKGKQFATATFTALAMMTSLGVSANAAKSACTTLGCVMLLLAVDSIVGVVDSKGTLTEDDRSSPRSLTTFRRRALCS